MKWSPGCQCCGEGCPCGSALWTWDAGASEWNVGSNTCSGACEPIEPTSPGTVDLEEQTTCCAFGCFGQKTVSTTLTSAALTEAQLRSFSLWELDPSNCEFTSITRLEELITYDKYIGSTCGSCNITAQRHRIEYRDIALCGGDKSEVYGIVVYSKASTGTFFGEYFTSLESNLYFGTIRVYPEGSGASPPSYDIDALCADENLVGGGLIAEIGVFVTGPSPVPGFTEPYANATAQSKYDWVTGYSATVG